MEIICNKRKLLFNCVKYRVYLYRYTLYILYYNDLENLDVNGLAKYNEDTDSLDVYYTDGELAGSIYCGFQYPVGKETNFAYTGSIQEFTIPASGLWKLEVYGAQGGSPSTGGGTGTGGKGGYALGYIILNKGDIIYVCVGGAGKERASSGTVSGGYNGGGNGYHNGTSRAGTGSGGGATHIAKKTGTLKELGTSNLSNIYIIAGGGGGGGVNGDKYAGYSGGTGGGTTGGSSGSVTGGTQSNGGSTNNPSFITAAGFGYGGSGTAGSNYSTGGGGGLYGGAGACYENGGSGGSGYTGGVPSIMFKNEQYTPHMTNGLNSGDGSAKLTFMGR